MNMKYFIYNRKSTEEEERQALSIESQKAENIKRFGDLEIVEVLEESYSASKPGRPVFTQMLERIEAGEADGIISWHPDRLSRNPVDAGNIIYALDTKKLKDLKFCSYTFENTPEGKMFLSIVLSQSKYQTDKLSVDIKRGNARKAVIGQPPRYATTGYKNIHLPGGQKTWIVDEENKLGYLGLLEKAKGPDETLKSLIDFTKKIGLKTRGGNDFCPATMDRWLRTKDLCGWFWQNDEYHKMIDIEPLINEDWWHEIQYARGYRSRPRPQRQYEFLLSGLVHCKECGCAVVTYAKEKYYKGTERRVIYTYCRCGKRKREIKCSQEQVTEKLLAKQVESYVGKVMIDKEIWELVRKLLKRKHKLEMSKQTEVLGRLQNEHKQVKIKLGRLLDLRISDVIDTDEEYIERKAILTAEDKRLNDLISNSAANIDKWLETAEGWFRTAYQAREVMKRGTLLEKRDIINKIGLNLLFYEKNLEFEYKKPFMVLANRPKNCDWWSWGDSNSRPKAKTRQL